MATQAQRDSFISKVSTIIQQKCKEHGWGIPSAIIAQAIIESNWGLSGLAKYNNLFGMKCGSSWKGKSVNMKTKEEYTVGTLTTIKDNFRAYDTLEDGIEGYFQFLSTSRYAPVRSALSAELYITQLKACGYATSSSYVNTLLTTRNTYGLSKYDDLTYSTVTSAENAVANNNNNIYNIGSVYTVQVRLNVRDSYMGKVLKVYSPGTRVTCKEIKVYDGIPWMRTPSGWICTRKGDKLYVK